MRWILSCFYRLGLNSFRRFSARTTWSSGWVLLSGLEVCSELTACHIVCRWERSVEASNINCSNYVNSLSQLGRYSVGELLACARSAYAVWRHEGIGCVWFCCVGMWTTILYIRVLWFLFFRDWEGRCGRIFAFFFWHQNRLYKICIVACDLIAVIQFLMLLT